MFDNIFILRRDDNLDYMKSKFACRRSSKLRTTYNLHRLEQKKNERKKAQQNMCAQCGVFARVWASKWLGGEESGDDARRQTEGKGV